MANFKDFLEGPFVWRSGVQTTEGTQRVLAALFVRRTSPDIRGLRKRQKIGREATGLAELMTAAEHFERTSEQGRKQKSAKPLA